MNITSSNVDIRSDHYYGASAINVRVKGYLSTYSCGIAAKAWKDVAAENHQRHLLVLDLTNMIAHEASSRKLLAKTIAQTSNKVKAVVIISDSLIHRIYLRLMLRSRGVPLITYRSDTQLSATRLTLIAS